MAGHAQVFVLITFLDLQLQFSLDNSVPDYL